MSGCEFGAQDAFTDGVKIASQFASAAPDSNMKTTPLEDSGDAFQSVFAAANGEQATRMAPNFQVLSAKQPATSANARTSDTTKRDAVPDQTVATRGTRDKTATTGDRTAAMKDQAVSTPIAPLPIQQAASAVAQAAPALPVNNEAPVQQGTHEPQLSVALPQVAPPAGTLTFSLIPAPFASVPLQGGASAIGSASVKAAYAPMQSSEVAPPVALPSPTGHDQVASPAGMLSPSVAPVAPQVGASASATPSENADGAAVQNGTSVSVAALPATAAVEQIASPASVFSSSLPPIAPQAEASAIAAPAGNVGDVATQTGNAAPLVMPLKATVSEERSAPAPSVSQTGIPASAAAKPLLHAAALAPLPPAVSSAAPAEPSITKATHVDLPASQSKPEQTASSPRSDRTADSSATASAAGSASSTPRTAAPAAQNTDAPSIATSVQPPVVSASAQTTAIAPAVGFTGYEASPAAVSPKGAAPSDAGVPVKGKALGSDVRGTRSDEANASDQPAGSAIAAIPFASKVSGPTEPGAHTPDATQGAIAAAAVQQPLQTAAAATAGHGLPGAQDGNAATGTAVQTPVSGAQMPVAGDALPGVSTAHLVQSANASEMRLGMQSAEFGNISISTSLNRQALSAQISIDHSELGRALAAHLPAIEEKLGTAYGLQARVELRESNQSSPSGNSGYSNSGQQAKEQRHSQGGAAQAAGGPVYAQGAMPALPSGLTTSTVTGAPSLSRLDIRI